MNNSCSPQELDELLAWLQSPGNRYFAEQLIAREVSSQPELQNTDAIRQRLNSRLQDILRQPEAKRSINPYWRAAAAAIIIAFVAGLAWLGTHRVDMPTL